MTFLSHNRLSRIAAIGGVGVVALGLYSCYRVANVYNDTPYFRDALATAAVHAGVKKFIGTPISTGYVSSVPSEDPSPIAEFTVKIRGPISSGIMHFWAERKASGETVTIDVNRIEVEISGDKSKRLIVKG